MVFQYTSPLTQFLNGRLTKDGNIKCKTIRAIWIDVFDIDWPEDLTMLPIPIPPNSYNGLRNEDLARVRSRSMFERLCRLLPNATESNACFAKEDKVVNRCVTEDKTDSIHLYHDCFKYYKPRLLHIPMRHMWLDVLADRIRQYPYACAQDCIIEGHTELLKHLIKSNMIDLRRIRNIVEDHENYHQNYASMDIASHQGQLEMLKMMHDAGCDSITSSAMDLAAMNGHFEVVEFLHESRTEGCTTVEMDKAAENGHLDVIKFLHVNRNEGCTTSAMDDATWFGHLDAIKWLHENRTEGCTSRAMVGAARNGHLDVVKWLHENRKEGCTTKAMDWAAENGYLDVVKWLHESRTEGCTDLAMNGAVRCSHAHVVQFLLENLTDGFDDAVFIYCKSPEIAEILIKSISHERRCKIMAIAMSKGWKGCGIDALKESLMLRLRFNHIRLWFIGTGRISISSLFPTFVTKNCSPTNNHNVSCNLWLLHNAALHNRHRHIPVPPH